MAGGGWLAAATAEMNGTHRGSSSSATGGLPMTEPAAGGTIVTLARSNTGPDWLEERTGRTRLAGWLAGWLAAGRTDEQTNRWARCTVD